MGYTPYGTNIKLDRLVDSADIQARSRISRLRA